MEFNWTNQTRSCRQGACETKLYFLDSSLCKLTIVRFTINYVQDLLSFTWMMKEMQRMQFGPLTELSLADRGDGFVLSGQRYITS